MSRLSYLLALFAAAYIGALAAGFLVEPDCGASDTCAFLECERQLGRPCTDEDVFGPAALCKLDSAHCDEEPQS